MVLLSKESATGRTHIREEIFIYFITVQEKIRGRATQKECTQDFLALQSTRSDLQNRNGDRETTGRQDGEKKERKKEEFGPPPKKNKQALIFLERQADNV